MITIIINHIAIINMIINVIIIFMIKLIVSITAPAAHHHQARRPAPRGCFTAGRRGTRSLQGEQPANTAG